jgi:undecaprenyl-diphosphatase
MLRMTTTRDATERDVDVAVESAPAKDWAHWASELARHQQERLAEFGGAVVAGCVAAVVVLYAFAWLAYEVLQQQTAALDTWSLQLLQRVGPAQLTRAAEAISWFGSELVWVVGLVLLGVLAWQRRWGAAVTLALVAGGAQLLNDVLKEVFHRARPESVQAIINAQQFSFPSGHAMVSMAFYLYIAYLTWRLVHGWRWRGLLIVGLILLVLLIGLARVYLQAHYLSDVLAGYLAGFLWTDAVILGGRALGARTRRRPRPRTVDG